MRRLEPRHRHAGDLRELLPQSGPETLWLDRDARHVADLVARLRLIPEVADEQRVALRDEQEAAGAGESRQIADVRETRDEQPVDVGGGQSLRQRGEASRS